MALGNSMHKLGTILGWKSTHMDFRCIVGGLVSPTPSPTAQPTLLPTLKPTVCPSVPPTVNHTASPTFYVAPPVMATAFPSSIPSSFPSLGLGSICGNVSEDTDNNDVGNVNLGGVRITLLDSSKNALTSSYTNSNGNYCFYDLPSGSYYVVEENLSGYIDVKDLDGHIPNGNAVTLGSVQIVILQHFLAG